MNVLYAKTLEYEKWRIAASDLETVASINKSLYPPPKPGLTGTQSCFWQDWLKIEATIEVANLTDELYKQILFVYVTANMKGS